MPQNKKKKNTGKKEPENQDNKIKDLESLVQRVQADFINFRNRVEIEKRDFLKLATKDLLLKIIPVLDNFNRAFSHVPKELEKNEWVFGIKQIEKQLEEVLKSEGLEKIETIGKEFDYNHHEAIGFEETKSVKDNEVIREVEAGYRLGERVLKPAKVIIAKNKNK